MSATTILSIFLLGTVIAGSLISFLSVLSNQRSFTDCRRL